MINPNTHQIDSIIIVAQNYLENNHYRDQFWQGKIAEACKELTEKNGLKIYYVPKAIKTVAFAGGIEIQVKKGVTVVSVMVVIDDPIDMENEELKNKWETEISNAIEHLRELYPQVLITNQFPIKVRINEGE